MSRAEFARGCRFYGFGPEVASDHRGQGHRGDFGNGTTASHVTSGARQMQSGRLVIKVEAPKRVAAVLGCCVLGLVHG